jgi:hypothetical protein
MPEVVVALPVFRGFCPVQEVRFLALGLLREQVVGDPDGELARFTELADDLIVFRVVLETAPASMAPVTPRRLSSRMKWRVELSW